MIFGSMELAGLSGHEAGRLLLKNLWQTHIGGELPQIAVTERGKPYFGDDPLHFSISHTKGHVFTVLSDRTIGIDAEEQDRQINLGLAEKILSPTERLRYDAAGDKREMLLKLWVLKEAWVKFTGEGLRGYPNHTDFSPDDPRVFIMDGCYVAVIEEE